MSVGGVSKRPKIIFWWKEKSFSLDGKCPDLSVRLFGKRQETYLPNFRLKIGHLETSTTETDHFLIFLEILARTISSAFLSNRAQLFKEWLALNPGLNSTRVSFSFVQKHFHGQFSLLCSRASNLNLQTKLTF